MMSLPTQDMLLCITGQALSNIVFEVLPDDLPETEEELTLTITRVEPQDTQRLRPSATQVKVRILENDSPGGLFQFGPETQGQYTIQVIHRTIKSATRNSTPCKNEH